MPSDANQTVLFDAPDFRVRFAAGARTDICFVTFYSLTDVPDLDRPGFGEEFFRERGIPAIHVLNRTNAWYAYPDFDKAIARIRARAAPFARIITYGSSMGGYAAIRFAEAIGAQAAVAISPQYSFAKRLTPFEHRWDSIVCQSPALTNEPAHGSKELAPVVFYDPADLDRLHFDLIAQHYPRAIGAPLRHSGHPAGAVLNETGLLSTALLEIAEGRFDSAALVHAARAGRRRSGQYLFTLARRLGPHHMPWKMNLASAAVAAGPDAAYLIYKALLLEIGGGMVEASAALQEAERLLPDHPIPLQALATFHLRAGDASAAAALAARLCAVNPLPDHRRLLVVALILAGRRAEALAALSRPWRNLLLRAALSARLPVGTVGRGWLIKPFRLKAQFDLYDEWSRRNRQKRPPGIFGS